MPASLSCGTTADVWLVTNGATAASSRSWIWNIISTCCIASRAHWLDRNRWSSGGKQVYGPPALIGIWQAPIERHGKQSGTRQMIELLKLSPKHGPIKLQEAIELALTGGCSDAAAVHHLLNAEELRHRSCEAIDVGALERYARPLPVMQEYDQLLTAGGGR
jgi:hypothetical protein